MKGASFSIGQALGAGFRLPVRHPLSVLVWGLMLSLVSAVFFALFLPVMGSWPLDEMAAAEPSEAFMQSMLTFQLAANGMNLIQLMVGLLIWTAAMRATLRMGQADRFFFLRFSMDELRVAVVMTAIIIGLYFGLIVMALIGVGIGFALYAAGELALVIGVFVMVFALLIGVLALWSRVSLIPPASMVLSEFAFVEGWQMGRGQTWRLMGLNVLMYLIYMVVYVLVALIVMAILVGGFQASGLVWPDDPQTMGEVLTAVKPMAGWIVLAYVPLMLFAGWTISFMAGALTSAARQLADGPPVA